MVFTKEEKDILVDRLTAWRYLNRFTLRDLEKPLHANYTQICKWENKKGRPSSKACFFIKYLLEHQELVGKPVVHPNVY